MKTTVIGMLLSPFLLMAQQNGTAWTNIGPSPAAVSAIAVDPQGQIYVSDIKGIQVFSSDGRYLSVIPPAGFGFAHGLAFDDAGALYFGANDKKIYKYLNDPVTFGQTLASIISGAQLVELTPKSVSKERHAADVQRALSDFLTKNFSAA